MAKINDDLFYTQLATEYTTIRKWKGSWRPEVYEAGEERMEEIEAQIIRRAGKRRANTLIEAMRTAGNSW